MVFDIEKFRLSRNFIENRTQPQKRPKRPRIAGNFLKGPIPLEWLQKASGLPGKAFQTGVVIWYLCGLRKSETVTLSNGLLEKFNISRKAKYRCLEALAGAGLIAIEHRPNRNPNVTLIPEKEE